MHEGYYTPAPRSVLRGYCQEIAAYVKGYMLMPTRRTEPCVFSCTALISSAKASPGRIDRRFCQAGCFISRHGFFKHISPEKFLLSDQ
jgi:hypothetical protein